MRSTVAYILIWFFGTQLLNAQASISGRITDDSGDQLEAVTIFIDNKGLMFESDKKGYFSVSGLEAGSYLMTFFLENYKAEKRAFTLEKNESKVIDIALQKLDVTLDEVEINASRSDEFQTRQLRNVEGMAIYASKKSEVIELRRMTANKATNNPRQIFKNIAGLNIWENDCGGLQLSIGARGLDPNRTSNFNTRQNGYDISADALGYPESYYTPPSHALDKVEIVRGAASLQYGPQFGGLLNFVFKKGNEDKPVEFSTFNTIGSAGLINSFSSVGGQLGKVNYYTFYQRKQGNGCRPNSEFHQNTAFANVGTKLNNKLKVGLEYTYMNYLAQQPGGLQDFEFSQDPYQSKRARNWFSVNWNLASVNFDYQFSDKSKLNSRSFFLYAKRQALGELGPINRPDPLRERDLIRGVYRNYGNETRFIHRYKIGNNYSTFLVGSRYYKGHSFSKQGDANDGAGPEFEFLSPEDLERSEYEFPSKNISLFAENLFYLTDYWTLTPGFRFENIQTASMGYFKERVFSGGELIFEQKIADAKENKRNFMLFGLGTSVKLDGKVEFYGNISQNFRPINFSDLAVVNPNLVVDSLLTDERGYNADLGVRGNFLNNRVSVDASLFYLRYKNRIGVGETIVSEPLIAERAVAFRTNIGDARIVGLESLIQTVLLPTTKIRKISLTHFVNFSLLNGRYLSGMSSFEGKHVELIPPISIKTGFDVKYKNLKLAYQYSYVGEQYSDATNAVFVASAERGIIPAYQVHDLALDYKFKNIELGTGINNLLNAKYFTRRANAYPGPGIIPADMRSFYLTLGLIF